MDSHVFANEELQLKCPAALENDPIFALLKNKCLTNFILTEQYRLNGPTAAQKHKAETTGVDFLFRSKLHISMKSLLREVIMTTEKDIQIKNLRKVYNWYLTKLASIGDLTQEEKEQSKELL